MSEQKKVPMLTQSPEVSPATCPGCGNSDHFVGTDHHGSEGQEACDCSRTGAQEHQKGCAVWEDITLTQEFRVISGSEENFEVEYVSHVGGCTGAEIGEYDEVSCGQCGVLLWRKDS
jgi:hypothetical protein